MYQSATPATGFHDGGVLKELRDAWTTAIKAGLQEKARIYARGAQECLAFFNGQHNYIFDQRFSANQLYLTTSSDNSAGKPSRIPHFLISDNVAAKFVQIIKPYLTQGVLVRTVLPNKPMYPPPEAYGLMPGIVEQFQATDPAIVQQMMQTNPMIAQQYQAMMQMQKEHQALNNDFQMRKFRSDALQMILNYAATEMNLRAERDKVTQESLVIGAGAYLTELVKMPDTEQKMITSNYIPYDDVVWDPDATQIKDCKWLAIQCRGPAWLVSRLYNTPESELNANASSTVSERYYEKLKVAAGPQNINQKSPTADEVVYWKVWSRMGSGARLRSYRDRSPTMSELDGMLGDFCFFIISDCCDYPLNLNQMVFSEAQQISQSLQMQQAMGIPPQEGQPKPFDPIHTACLWPTRYYLDVDDPWPLTTQEFHIRTGSPYPIPHLEFSLSYMKFMVWILSFVADKCYRSNRDFWLIDDSVSEQLREAIENGEDESIIKIKDLDKKTLDAFVKLIEAPEVNKSIIDVYEFFEKKFGQMSGLTELMQSQLSRSMRTATEAQVVSDASQLRPQSMAQVVAACDTRVARKEAIAWQKHGTMQDTAAILSPPSAKLWQTLNQGYDEVQLLRETQFDVLSSPGKVLDLQTRQDQANKMSTNVLPIMIQYGQMSGNYKPANAILTEYAKSNQIDPDLVLLPDLPPPPPAPAKGVASAPKEKTEQQGKA